MLMPLPKVYTTPNCPTCLRVKEYFKSIGTAYEEVRVDLDDKAAEELIEKSGQMTVPVTEIGDSIITGFNPGAIRIALGK